jgi:hypothetical protein
VCSPFSSKDKQRHQAEHQIERERPERGEGFDFLARERAAWIAASASTTPKDAITGIAKPIAVAAIAVVPKVANSAR